MTLLGSVHTLLRVEFTMKRPMWTCHLRTKLLNESTAQSKRWHAASFMMLASQIYFGAMLYFTAATSSTSYHLV
jgi:hypothetical protein